MGGGVHTLRREGRNAANYVSTNGTRGHNRPRYEEGNENEALHRNATIDKFACLCCYAACWSLVDLGRGRMSVWRWQPIRLKFIVIWA